MKPVSDAAADFAVWRARRVLGDDATPEAIAARAVLPLPRIRQVLRRRGWSVATAPDHDPLPLTEEFL